LDNYGGFTLEILPVEKMQEYLANCELYGWPGGADKPGRIVAWLKTYELRKLWTNRGE